MSWTKDSFLSLLLIYASNVDMEINESEHEWISNKLGENSYETARQYFNDHSEYQVLQQIISLKDEFLQDENALDTCKEYLDGLFAADGEYTDFEHDVYNLLKKILK